MSQRARIMLAGCAEIFFLHGSLSGAALLAVTFLVPAMGALGVLAVLAAYGFAGLIGMEKAFRECGCYVYNPLFVGLSLGCRFEITPLVCLLTIAAGVLTMLATLALAHLLLAGQRLPVLSLPFLLVSIPLSLAAMKYARPLTAVPLPPAVLAWDAAGPRAAADFLRCMGAVLFLPHVAVGLFVTLLVAAASRILLLLAVCGYVLGVALRGMFLGTLDAALADGQNFTFILLGMGIGGVFLVPSLQASLLAIIAVAVSPPVIEACSLLGNRFGIAPFTLPFCLVSLGMLYALQRANYPLLSSGIGGSPEGVREHALVHRLRYPGQLRTLALPFSGCWTAWQGFNGRWTHRGVWRHAYDFLITDAEGRTHRGPGTRLQDYYCYGMPVLAPVRGHVARVLDHVPDNAAGSVGGGNNWGNLVVLHDPRGFYVALSHFIPGSICVQPGTWVERGTLLGRCGNSGYSPQPHVHVQVQASDAPGAATLPFSFAAYRDGERYYANDVPREGRRIEPLHPEQRLHDRTNFRLDDEHEYRVLRRGRLVRQMRLQTAIAADGTCYFRTARGRLYFGKHEGTFYFYRVDGNDPCLRRMFLALPRLPLAYRGGMTWVDYVPLSVAASGMRAALAQLGAFLWPRLAAVRVTQRFCDENTVESVAESRLLGLKIVARVEGDAETALASVTVGDVRIERLGLVSGLALFARSPQPSPDERSDTMMSSAIASLATAALALGANPDLLSDAPLRQSVQQSCLEESHKNYPQAIAALQAPLAAHPADYLLNLRLGWLHYLHKQYPQAQRHYQAAIDAAPKSVEAKLGCLLPLLAGGQYKAAETLAREILQADPRNYYANLRLAVALRFQRQCGEPRDIVRQMLAAYPSDANFQEEQRLLDAVQGGPGHDAPKTPLQEALARSLQAEQHQDYAGAIQILLAQQAVQPHDYTLNARLGWLHYLSGDYYSASQYYYAALQINAKATEAGLGYLLALLAQERYAEAEGLARQILGGDPGNYYANLRLCVALRAQKKLDQAEPLAASMRQRYPADVAWMQETAQLKLAAGDQAAAKALLADVVCLDPGNTLAAQLLRGL